MATHRIVGAVDGGWGECNEEWGSEGGGLSKRTTADVPVYNACMHACMQSCLLAKTSASSLHVWNTPVVVAVATVTVTVAA